MGPIQRLICNGRSRGPNLQHFEHLTGNYETDEVDLHHSVSAVGQYIENPFTAAALVDMWSRKALVILRSALETSKAL